MHHTECRSSHIKRIALGVPEDKVCLVIHVIWSNVQSSSLQWDHLFEEITRVMKPGGAFEVSDIGMVLSN